MAKPDATLRLCMIAEHTSQDWLVQAEGTGKVETRQVFCMPWAKQHRKLCKYVPSMPSSTMPLVTSLPPGRSSNPLLEHDNIPVSPPPFDQP